jgi:hypothetical protein
MGYPHKILRTKMFYMKKVTSLPDLTVHVNEPANIHENSNGHGHGNEHGHEHEN